MFTGIVQGLAEVKKVEKRKGYDIFSLQFPIEHLTGLELGASIAIDGVCLTAVTINNPIVTFDVIKNSLSITSLDAKKPGDLLNFERSLKNDSEIGGHFLSGHVDFAARVKAVHTYDSTYGLCIEHAPTWSKYIFEKGFIGINGASLTVSNVNKESNQFTCWLIPETLKRTNLSQLATGDLVNIELDRNTQIIVDTIYSVAEEKFGALSRHLTEALKHMGFVDEFKMELAKVLAESRKPMLLEKSTNQHLPLG